jgi:hypothetical protein
MIESRERERESDRLKMKRERERTMMGQDKITLLIFWCKHFQGMGGRGRERIVFL